MILIFVTSKITSHYMYEVIQDLKKMDPQYKDFSVDFVQGVGRKDTESH
jgi:outer membrane lipoprotein-sorting protein